MREPKRKQVQRKNAQIYALVESGAGHLSAHSKQSLQLILFILNTFHSVYIHFFRTFVQLSHLAFQP